MFVPKIKNQIIKITATAGLAILTSMAVGIFPGVAFATPVTSDKLVELTNEARVENGLPQLTVNSLLVSSAQGKSSDMLEKNYFAHTSPEGLSPWYWLKLEGYTYIYAGENLAKNYASAEAMFDAWMASPTHRANILSVNFKDIGIAIASNESVLYATSHFGARKDSTAGIVTTTPSASPVAAPAPVVARDTTAPTIKTIDSSGTIKQGGKVTFGLEVDGDPVAVVAKVGEKSVDLAFSNGKWVGELTLFAGGTYNVIAEAKDAAGNTATSKMGTVTVELPELIRESPTTRTLVAAYWKEVATNEAAPISLALIAMLIVAGSFATYTFQSRRLLHRVAQLVSARIAT